MCAHKNNNKNIEKVYRRICPLITLLLKPEKNIKHIKFPLKIHTLKILL